MKDEYFILFIPLGVMAVFGITSLLITQLLGKTIWVWCRKRWLEVITANATETELTKFLYQRLAKDQMKSLFSEAVFNVLCGIIALAFIGMGVATSIIYNEGFAIILVFLLPSLPVIPYFWYFQRNINLFTKYDAGESQTMLSYRYWGYLLGSGFLFCLLGLIVYQNGEFIGVGIMYGFGCFIATILLFAFGRLAIIQLNKRLPVPAHEEQMDILVQKLLLTQPDYSRRWLIENMEHENSKVASFAQKWAQKYL